MQKILSILLSLLAVLWNVAILSAADRPEENKRPVSSLGFARLAVNVPVKMDEAQRKTIIEQLVELERQRFVYLDLSVDFLLDDEGVNETAPYSLMINGKRPSSARGGCSFGRLPMGRGASYDLAPIAGYNHLLMTVFTGDRASFPYNDISCEYLSGGRQRQFRLRGFFHVMANAVPTAVSLQLRPLNPPFDLARQVLVQD